MLVRKLINYGSFDYVKIVGVKKDIADKTLTIPTHIIVPMNADSIHLHLQLRWSKVVINYILSGSGMVVTSYMQLGERLTSGVCRLAG